MSGSSAFANTTNLLVPANASTHCVRTSFVAGGVPENINFNSFTLDNFPFNPQSAYFDNTAGSEDMIVTIVGLGFVLTIPTGTLVVSNFPSPANISVNITGAGPVNIFWCDYPQMLQPPGGVAQAVTIGNQPIATTVTGGQVGIIGNTPVDESVTNTVSNASSPLLAANPNRKSLMIQAPQTAGIELNFAGGVAGPNLSGNITLPAGAIYESGITVNQNAINYYCVTGGLVIPVLEG
jgi:hypothetical protein